MTAEQRERLEFYDAATMKLANSVWVPCKGIDHMDFSSNGRYFIASCEFGEAVVKFDVERQKLIGRLKVNPAGMPQDVKLSPDGTVFYVADMHADGVHLIDGENLRQIGFIPTGKGAHGLYVSRDSRWLYVSNRGEGSVSLIALETRKAATKWWLPGPASPDMGGVSADGKVLWPAGGTPKSTPSAPPAESRSRAFRWVTARMGFASIPSPGVIRWATPAYFDKAAHQAERWRGAGDQFNLRRS